MKKRRKNMTNSEETKTQPAMTKAQAFEIINQALSQFRGTLQEHQIIGQAFMLIKGAEVNDNSS